MFTLRNVRTLVVGFTVASLATVGLLAGTAVSASAVTTSASSSALHFPLPEPNILTKLLSTKTTLTSSKNDQFDEATDYSPVVYTAVVQDSLGGPVTGGSVTFTYFDADTGGTIFTIGTSPVGSCSASGCVASITALFPNGLWTIYANYGGSYPFGPSSDYIGQFVTNPTTLNIQFDDFPVNCVQQYWSISVSPLDELENADFIDADITVNGKTATEDFFANEGTYLVANPLNTNSGLFAAGSHITLNVQMTQVSVSFPLPGYMQNQQKTISETIVAGGSDCE
jgi:hypothetical protein